MFIDEIKKYTICVFLLAIAIFGIFFSYENLTGFFSLDENISEEKTRALIEDIETIETLSEDYEGRGIDISKVNELITKSKIAVENEKYSESVGYLREAEFELNEANLRFSFNGYWWILLILLIISPLIFFVVKKFKVVFSLRKIVCLKKELKIINKLIKNTKRDKDKKKIIDFVYKAKIHKYDEKVKEIKENILELNAFLRRKELLKKEFKIKNLFWVVMVLCFSVIWALLSFVLNLTLDSQLSYIFSLLIGLIFASFLMYSLKKFGVGLLFIVLGGLFSFWIPNLIVSGLNKVIVLLVAGAILELFSLTRIQSKGVCLGIIIGTAISGISIPLTIGFLLPLVVAVNLFEVILNLGILSFFVGLAGGTLGYVIWHVIGEKNLNMVEDRV